MSQNLPTTGLHDEQDGPGPTVTPRMWPGSGRPGFMPGPEFPAPDRVSQFPIPHQSCRALQQPRRGRRLAKKPEEPASPLTAERLLILDGVRIKPG